MKNTNLENVEIKLEDNSVKLGRCEALMIALNDNFDEIVEAGKNGKESEQIFFTHYEFKRKQKQSETLFAMLSELLSESCEANSEALRKIARMNVDEANE